MIYRTTSEEIVTAILYHLNPNETHHFGRICQTRALAMAVSHVN